MVEILTHKKGGQNKAPWPLANSLMQNGHGFTNVAVAQILKKKSFHPRFTQSYANYLTKHLILATPL